MRRRAGVQRFRDGQPGRVATIFTDTDCDGENDAFVDIDTSQTGWAMYDGTATTSATSRYEEPRRTYKALEFVLDRAWDDKWSLNATYTLAFNEGNAEGPVNSDTDFGDTGRTENFDDPWVNYGGYRLPAERSPAPVQGARHLWLQRQLARRHDVGCTIRPSDQRLRQRTIPSMASRISSFFICTANCDSETDAEYELLGRGSQGRTPWIFDVGLNVTWSTLRTDRHDGEARGLQPAQPGTGARSG